MSFISTQSLRASSRTPSASPAAVETASPAPPLRWPAGSSGDHVCAGSPHPRAHVARASRSPPGLSGRPPPRVAPPPLTASLTSIANLSLMLSSASPARMAPP